MKKTLLSIIFLITLCICGCTDTPSSGKVTWYGPDGVHVWENASGITIRSTGEFNFNTQQGQTIAIFGNTIVEK
jgi:hypothetical protein